MNFFRTTDTTDTTDTTIWKPGLMTTPQINNLIGRVRKSNLAARAARVARTYEEVRAVLSKTTKWNYHITILLTT